MTSTLATEVGLLGGVQAASNPSPLPPPSWALPPVPLSGLSRGQERPCLLSLPWDGSWAQPTCQPGPKGAPNRASAEA